MACGPRAARRGLNLYLTGMKMSRLSACLAVCLTLSIPMSAARSAPPIASDIHLLTWPRMPVEQFGCYLEKSFGHRDARFNCSLENYENQGDPCKNTEAFYEGPEFPQALAAEVNPLATDVDLAWEQGQLQQVTITLKGRLTEEQARRALDLPDADSHDTPENVMYIDVQYPDAASTAVSLTGFDHMGAGDVDCDAPEEGSGKAAGK
jgi:hypothetical protein